MVPQMKFTKMQGIGNDYIYVNTFDEAVENPETLAIAMSRQHFGVSSDGLVLIGPSLTADFAMRMFNADGSEAEMCGNAARCIGKYVYERGLTKKAKLTLETRGGPKTLNLQIDAGCVRQVTVDMGEPTLTPASIPVDLPGSSIRDFPLRVAGRIHRITCVNMGNPHAVVFVDDPDAVDVRTMGMQMENHAAFPQRTNVEFVHVARRDLLELRVWERGSGETLACGTGACASVVAAVVNGLSERSVNVRLTGGELQITWDGATNHVLQTGPAAFVFDGVWLGA